MVACDGCGVENGAVGTDQQPIYVKPAKVNAHICAAGMKGTPNQSQPFKGELCPACFAALSAALKSRIKEELAALRAAKCPH